MKTHKMNVFLYYNTIIGLYKIYYKENNAAKNA
jgi:hypothetical protein